ncbi:hypothetical protein Goshw_028602, partial [Gossypium schwendimanii]|nr:hypothetical protein [Gossypium schwendimanii]
MNSGKIVAVGPGAREKDGKFIPLNLKEGDTVLLPEYGGTEIKLGEKDSGLRIVSFWVSGLFEFDLGLSIQDWFDLVQVEISGFKVSGYLGFQFLLSLDHWKMFFLMMFELDWTGKLNRELVWRMALNWLDWKL